MPILAGLAVLWLPLPLEPAGRRALAITTWMVLSWILEPIHPAIVGFAGCFFFVAARCAPFDTAFGGFGTETPWFLYGALMLLTAARTSGAIRRIELLVPNPAARTFAGASGAVVVVAFLAGLVVDAAIARAVITVALALAIGGAMARRYTVSATTPLVTVASYAATVLGREGPGQDPGPSIAWRLVTVVICIALSAMFVRPASDMGTGGDEQERDRDAAGRVLALLVLAAAAWLTTAWHGVSPAVIGLGAGLAGAFPGLRPGAKGPVADPIALILAGAALSVPLVLEETRAAGAIAPVLQSSLGAYGEHVVAGLLDPRVQGTGNLPAVKVALYQSPALILGAAVAGFTTRDILKFGAALALAGAVFALVS